MAERRRGLGRGLGALIPSGPTQEDAVPDKTDEGRPSATAGSNVSAVSRETRAVATAQGREPGSKRSQEDSTHAETSTRTEDQDGAEVFSEPEDSRETNAKASKELSREEVGQAKANVSITEAPKAGKKKRKKSASDVRNDQAAPPATSPASTDVSRETPPRRKRTVSAESRQKAMKARMDLGASARSSTARPSDMFFTPSPEESEGRDPDFVESAMEPDSEPSGSHPADSTVSRETHAPAPNRSQGDEGAGGSRADNKTSRVEGSGTDDLVADVVSGKPEDAAQDTSGASHVDVGDASDQEHQELQIVPGATFVELSVEDIHPNRKQPRQVFDEDELAELAYSIGELGVLQPVVVRPSREEGGPAYELVMGERRWRATQRAGLELIPAIVRETSDDDLLRDALLENLHRSQLNPLEEAAAYQQLLDEFGASQEELSRRIGRSRPQISNTLRLLRLPALVQRRVAAGILSAGHARALLSLEDPAEMERLAQRIVAEGLSVRATEEAVTLSKSRKPSVRRSAVTQERHRERLDYIADAFADKLDTSVKINLGARKGRMMIEFASVEDLNRIISVLDPEGLPEGRD